MILEVWGAPGLNFDPVDSARAEVGRPNALQSLPILLNLISTHMASECTPNAPHGYQMFPYGPIWLLNASHMAPHGPSKIDEHLLKFDGQIIKTLRKTINLHPNPMPAPVEF